MSSVLIEHNSIKYRESDGKIFFTYDDIQQLSEWPEGPLIQILGGELYMTPSPTLYLQEISGRIEYKFREFNTKNKFGWIYSAPIDVILDRENVVIPDIVMILNSNSQIRKEKNIQGVPNMIIEILSTNRFSDLVTKKALYEEFKVKEYIIIDPLEKKIMQYNYKEENYILTEYNQNEILKFSTINLEIAIKEIF